ncbi:MAG: type II toxin-antitoxin system VapC family toxin [Verrucomicrobia bacterium]|nr:type II toxin-antitoxin system VapC family toxin [Verrucomicrobiota bacterium]
MKKLRIYLDTSIPNFLFAEDAPDFRRATEEFFAKHAQKYELFASEVVILEIMRDPNPEHRQKLLDALHRHPITMLTGDPEIERLADLYLAQGIIPAKKREDALHVAHATVHELDILLSWNFKHLANVRREALIAAINQQEGHWHTLRLVSPLEVEDENQA